VLARYAATQERFAQLSGWAYAARVDALRGRLGGYLADYPGAVLVITHAPRARPAGSS
jgi:hypothetical protein